MPSQNYLCSECRQNDDGIKLIRSRRRRRCRQCRPNHMQPPSVGILLSVHSSVYFLGLLTCAAVVIVQALASSNPNSFSHWGLRGGTSTTSNHVNFGHLGKPKGVKGVPSLPMTQSENDSELEDSEEVELQVEIPTPVIETLNGRMASHNKEHVQSTHISANVAINGSNVASHPSKAKKTIITPGGFADSILPATYVAETNLPTDLGHFRIRAYRIEDDGEAVSSDHPISALGSGAGLGSEPCVIYCTDKPPFGRRKEVGGKRGGARSVPVRIHDQCFTSEVFRSQRCDCKEQLKMSLEHILHHGGAIIYLQQEGRGIGLANKVAAYALQDIGLDTVDANTHLGFPEDARQYGVVPSILADMGIDSIKLMTNNPRKIERLRALGVEVEGTIPMVVPRANKWNRRYLETKAERMNHSNFGSMLSESFDGMDVDGNLASHGKSVAEDYVTDGEEMAAAAVTAALLDDPNQSGVRASEDGYCFGRQSVEDAIAAVKRGELIVVVDDESRENEGDFIMAADKATPETMAQIIRYSSGVICIGMEGKRMDELKLPPMVGKNEDPKGTAFSVSVDASKKHGITTGISATDRAKTSLLLAQPDTHPGDFSRPGHIFPLRAKDNGVLTRDGHTEAAVDFSRLAGSFPAGLLCEIVSEENPVEMARLPELKRFCRRNGYVLTSIADLQQYRRDTGL